MSESREEVWRIRRSFFFPPRERWGGREISRPPPLWTSRATTNASSRPGGLSPISSFSRMMAISTQSRAQLRPLSITPLTPKVRSPEYPIVTGARVTIERLGAAGGAAAEGADDATAAFEDSASAAAAGASASAAGAAAAAAAAASGSLPLLPPPPMPKTMVVLGGKKEKERREKRERRKRGEKK